MKTIILASIITILTTITLTDEKDYLKAMDKNVKELKKAKSSNDFMDLASNFEQITDKVTDEWLPYYYISYCYLNTVFPATDSENIDKTLDKAEAMLKKARELSPENSEIEVLQGWIYQGRIQVDPMGRGANYSQKASASFGKAQNIDPDNPRIYFLTGQNVLYTPEMYGGGKEAACPYFLKAKEKYETFKPESSISPDWGEEYNDKQAAECK